MSRQEAIERMAKALKKVIYILSEEACLEGCEAALNSVLEWEWLLNGTANIEVVGLKEK